MTRFALLLLGCVAALGCSEDLDPTYLLNKPRVLGAEATIVGDTEGRTNPMPGETVRIEWILAFPDTPLPSTFVLFACEPAPTAFGVPFCAGDETLALEIGLEPSLDAPEIEVEIPADYESSQFLLLGGICMGGVVDTTIDVDDPEAAVQVCADGEGAGQLVSLLHIVDIDGERNNHRPGIAELTLAGEAWTAPVPDDVSAGCTGLDLPTFQVDGDDVQLQIAMTEGSRESFMAEEGDPPMEVTRIESLQNSLFVTAGELDRSFSFIESEGATVTEEIDYTPPTADDEDVDVPAEGLVVKTIVVMRDLRGGVDKAERALCIMP